MEELLIVVLQFIFETALEILSYVPFDWPWRNPMAPESQSVVLRSCVAFVGGCCLAGASLLVVGHTLIAWSSMRIANLLAAPIASAFVMQRLALLRTRRNNFVVPRNHFWQAFFFTLGLVVVRFAYAGRP